MSEVPGDEGYTPKGGADVATIETEKVEITFEPLASYLQFYCPADKDAPNEMELSIMHDAHRIYGPVTMEVCGGDAYKAARQISILALAMTMRPGTYPDQAAKSDAKLKAIPGGKS